MSQAAESGYAAAERRVATGAEPLPDRRVFWQWVWSAIRPVLGWVLALLGAAALFAGWYGVSGETLTAKQLPYLVSGGLTGIALVVLAAAFLATEDFRRQVDRIGDLEAKIDDLYRLFAAELAQPAPPPGDLVPVRTAAPAAATSAAGPGSGVVALPGGASYHRVDCTLVRGKAEAGPVDAKAARERSLRPCRVCDPPRLG